MGNGFKSWYKYNSVQAQEQYCLIVKQFICLNIFIYIQGNFILEWFYEIGSDDKGNYKIGDRRQYKVFNQVSC